MTDQKYSVEDRDSGKLVGIFTGEQINKIKFSNDYYIVTKLDKERTQLKKDLSTKRPWKFTVSSKHNRPQISGESGHQICLMWRDGEMEANAKLIVKAVNCHDELVEALKAIINEIEKHHLNTFSRGDLLYKAEQALQKAGEL